MSLRGSSIGRSLRSAAERVAAAGRVAADHPYVISIVVLVTALAVIGVGPARSFLSTNARVDSLAARRDRLASEVARLESQRERLNDPEEVELLAREELGYRKPNEIPVVVVSPEPRRQPSTPTPSLPDAQRVPGAETGQGGDGTDRQESGSAWYEPLTDVFDWLSG
jgi:cell division protein FtsB